MTGVVETKDTLSFDVVLDDLLAIKTSVTLTMTKTKKLRDLVAKQSKLLDKKKKNEVERTGIPGRCPINRCVGFELWFTLVLNPGVDEIAIRLPAGNYKHALTRQRCTG